MYGNVDSDILWFRLLAKYLIKKLNMPRSQEDSYIFHKKDDKGKVELVMSMHVDDVFMAVKSETLEKLKELINLKFNIQESVEVKKFLGVYYEWVHDEKGPYAKINMEKDVNKLVKGYAKFSGKYINA